MNIENKEAKSSFFEILSASVIALTTIMTAWSAYQSNLWSGVQTFALQESTNATAIAAEKTVIAQQRQMWDGILIINFGNAFMEGKTEVVENYRKRVRPELREVIDAWLATKPMENPNAPLHPMAMPQYEKIRSKFNSEIKTYKEQAKNEQQKANQASAVSDKYVLMTVLLASVLFFEAISSRFQSPKISKVLLIMAMILFFAVTAMIATFPIAQG